MGRGYDVRTPLWIKRLPSLVLFYKLIRTNYLQLVDYAPRSRSTCQWKMEIVFTTLQAAHGGTVKGFKGFVIDGGKEKDFDCKFPPSHKFYNIEEDRG
jgi:hypothetical protein